MNKLLMISGKGATQTALGKRNAFYNTLEELHKYFETIDVLCEAQGKLFDNVFFHKTMPDKHFDVMTVHEYAPFRHGRLANRIYAKTKIPMIFEIMHIPGLPKSGSWREYVSRLLTRIYIKHDVRQAKAVRVINSQIADWLIGCGVEPQKIKLVPAFYIDFEVFHPPVDGPVDKKYDLIYVGRRASNKGIDLFESAVQKLQVTSSKLQALVVDGWAKDSQEIADLLRQSKMLIMPSYNEGGPRVVLEALACGVPVLATPVGIVPEVVPPEFIIDWSADDIAQKAQKILSGKMTFPFPDLSVYEKKSAIKNYAEFIKSCAK